MTELTNQIADAKTAVVKAYASRLMSEFAAGDKTCLVGVPGSGKTTMAMELSDRGMNVHHTDTMITDNFYRSRNNVIKLMREEGGWLIEVIGALWALQELFRRDAKAPCNRVIWLSSSRMSLTEGQERMASGLRTVWNEIEPKLNEQGVTVKVGF